MAQRNGSSHRVPRTLPDARRQVVAFVLPGGINWTVMWIGLAIVALSAIVGLVLRNMGHGAKEN